MWYRNIIILLIVLFLINNYAIAQQTSAPKATTGVETKRESYKGKSRFTRYLYHLLTNEDDSKRKVEKQRIQKPYYSYNGKTIRHIHIETLDPYGYSINDTISRKLNMLFLTGNTIHLKTRNEIIQNLLLIQQNEPFDELKAEESERLIRSMEYIRDVSFFVNQTAKNSDSVDVFIRALDRWSLIPFASKSTSLTSLHLSDKNLLGMGHKIQTDFSRNHIKNTNAFKTNYSVPNIGNTYIGSILHFNFDTDNNYSRGLFINRSFFSPLTNWAAGINLMQQNRTYSFNGTNSSIILQQVKTNTQDLWAGYAFQLFKEDMVYNRSTNLIVAASSLRIRYPDDPIGGNDRLPFFQNENLHLASIGISTRKYVQQKFLFKFGITEDVPIGNVFNVTGGFHKQNDTIRNYLGARFSFGKYYTWGYLSSNIEYGAFSMATKIEQGAVKAGINYFTGLIEIDRWKFRQFVKPEITIGLNRFASDNLTINEGYGLDGFHSTTLSGIQRILLTLQTQAYAPWNFIGFYFGPYVMCSMGMLGNATSGFKNSKVYTQFGLGVLIRNENLALVTLQLSVAYYPSIPGEGENIFKMNSFKAADFGLRDFETGKPSTVEFR